MLRAVLLVLAFTTTARAQWDVQNSGTTASLRGIHSLGKGVAWASGSGGTILRTIDGGAQWQRCATPPGAEKLDFRGIQAFDASTAIVMSSGKGVLSRLYKTTNACQTWKKVFDDPDEAGFFDSLRLVTGKQLYLLGDPVGGKFSMFLSQDAGDTWFIADDPGLDAPSQAGAFAASNSALINAGPFVSFGTGGERAAVYSLLPRCEPGKPESCVSAWQAADTPLAHGSPPAGISSLAGRFSTNQAGKLSTLLVAVGGVYDKPDETAGTAAFSRDGGRTWTAAATPPHGYRSSVVYDASTGVWIAVGPNGTDISPDEGRTWRAIAPASTDQPGADKNWNALSLPFVVGSKGRIGVLRPNTLISKP